jgi:4'-phosphopantetheinyl transferase
MRVAPPGRPAISHFRWMPLPAAAPLGRGDVHLWYGTLDMGPLELARLAATLDDDEVRRAERFVMRCHGDRFVAARGLLRAVLGRYLGIEPPEVRFSYGARGKPELADELGSGISFNLSHSHDMALLAVTRDREVGADIERVDERVEVESIASRFFSASENADLQTLPAELRRETFFRCWTRKEAYVKALGDGLAHPLHDFDVSLRPDEPARLRATRPDPEEAARWSLVDLTPATGYVGAVMVAGSTRCSDRSTRPSGSYR